MGGYTYELIVVVNVGELLLRELHLAWAGDVVDAVLLQHFIPLIDSVVEASGSDFARIV